MAAFKRYLELRDQTSSKFWEIEVQGQKFVVRFGRIGTKGSLNEKVFDSPEQAEKEAHKLITSKLKKGYAEPAGPKFDVFQFRKIDYRIGKGLDRPESTIFRLSVDYDDEHSFEDLFAAFLKEPQLSEVRALSIGMWTDVLSDAVDTPSRLLIEAAEKMPQLEALYYADVEQEESEISWIELPDLAAVAHAFPNLEVLRIRGSHLRLEQLHHDKLGALIIESGGTSKETLADICAAKLPALQHLEIWIGVEDYGWDGSIADIEPLFETGRFPSLRHLGVMNAKEQDEIARAAAQSDLVQGLDSLDLSMGVLTDAGARYLLQSDAVRNLKSLNLRYHFMSDAVVLKFQDLGPAVNTSGQNEPDRDDDEVYFYTEVSE